MNKIIQVINQKKPTFSFELFPPKTDKGYEKLKDTIGELCALKPDFISCTYGAGGGSRDKTFEIVQLIEKQYNTIGLAHLTCVLNTKKDIEAILTDIQSRGIKNILALRGDPPQDNPRWTPTKKHFQYSSELVAFARSAFGDYFGIGVAGFPEGHVLCRDKNKDASYLKLKIDQGADFVITQLFFNNQDYFNYINRLRSIGVTAPVLPGLIPITDYNSLKRFCNLCGATITDDIKQIFEPIKDNPEATIQAGIDFAVKQGKDLLAGGAPGLHFYCLNKIHPTKEILLQIQSRTN